MPASWKISAPNAVQLFDLRDTITKTLITNATVTGKLKNYNKTADIADSSFSIPVVDGSIGHYGGHSAIQSFTEGTLMWLEILAIVNGGVVLRQDIEVVASRR